MSNTKKAPKVKASKLNTANLKKAAHDAVTERATKYRYPEDVASKEDRKAYRRKMRKLRDELQDAIKAAKKEGKKDLIGKAEKAWEQFQKSNYNPKVETKEAVPA